MATFNDSILPFSLGGNRHNCSLKGWTQQFFFFFAAEGRGLWGVERGVLCVGSRERTREELFVWDRCPRACTSVCHFVQTAKLNGTTPAEKCEE